MDDRRRVMMGTRRVARRVSTPGIALRRLWSAVTGDRIFDIENHHFFVFPSPSHSHRGAFVISTRAARPRARSPLPLPLRNGSPCTPLRFHHRIPLHIPRARFRTQTTYLFFLFYPDPSTLSDDDGGRESTTNEH